MQSKEAKPSTYQGVQDVGFVQIGQEQKVVDCLDLIGVAEAKSDLLPVDGPNSIGETEREMLVGLVEKFTAFPSGIMERSPRFCFGLHECRCRFALFLQLAYFIIFWFVRYSYFCSPLRPAPQHKQTSPTFSSGLTVVIIHFNLKHRPSQADRPGRRLNSGGQRDVQRRVMVDRQAAAFFVKYFRSWIFCLKPELQRCQNGQLPRPWQDCC
jgi:hypothetical protein